MRRLRRMKKLTFAAVFMMVSTLALPLAAPPAMAQATTGGIRGVVSDQSGAVVGGADVIARNAATGVETRTRSNDSGLYSFPRLAQGRYTIIVERDGFKRAELTDVVVSIGIDQALDVMLEAGLGTETVTVTAGSEAAVQKEQVQISSTFEERKVAELPSNIAGGGIDTLALLAPGVVPGFGNVNSNGTTLSVNGQRARSNNFTIDGQDNNDLSIGGPNYFVNNQDTVAEFQVITNNFSAEYGRNQGAIVNIVTKSGTNEFHGSGFWFHRDRKLWDSLNNIEKRGGRTEPTPFLYNVYGGTVGGPVIKDRAFFFGSYQAVTGRESFISRSINPTIAPEELGRLKSLFPNSAAIQNLADFSAFAITDFGTLRERTDRPTNTTIVIGGQTFRTAYPEREFATPFTEHQISGRGDVRITDAHSVWWRHLYQTVDNKNFLGGSSGFTADIPASSTHTGGTLTSQISNTAVNEFQFAFSRLSVIFGGGCEGLKGCITHPDQIADSLTNISFPAFRNSRGDQIQTIGAATNLPQGRVVTVYQFRNNFSKTFGRHQFKMGADIRRLTNSVPFLPNVNGAFRFSTSAQLVNNTPASVTLGAGQVEISYNETDQFYYFQDDWRIRDNLTLNLGIRYEYTGQPINTLHDISLARESDPATALWRQSLPIEARTFPKLDADTNNWAPRLGFAWRPNFGDGALARVLFGEQDQFIVSGGYSIAYDPGFYNIMLNVSTSAPLVFLNTVGGANFPIPSNPTGSAVQSTAAQRGILQVNTFDPRFLAQTIVAPDFHSPYSQQWSFRMQREISRNNVVEARYVGTKAVGLFQTVNRNPFIGTLANGFSIGPFNFPGFPGVLPPGVSPLNCVDVPGTPDNEGACAGRVLPQGLIRSRENTAFSSYHGLQTRWQANVFNQLSFGASYTWSKALDNASEIFSFFENASAQHPFNITDAEKSLSGFDRRHSFALNYIWDVPAFRSQEGFLGRVLGGWQLNGTYYLANGQRYTPSQFFSSFIGPGTYVDRIYNQTFFGFDNTRPFYGNPNAPATEVGINQLDAAIIFGAPLVDPNGFYSFNEINRSGSFVAVSKDAVRYIFNGPGASRALGTPFGDVPRNAEAGPRINQFNAGLFKNIRIKENIRLQFRAEGFNVLNHPTPGIGVVGGGRTPNFFIETAGAPDGFNDRGGITYARRVWQLGLRVQF